MAATRAPRRGPGRSVRAAALKHFVSFSSVSFAGRPSRKKYVTAFGAEVRRGTSIPMHISCVRTCRRLSPSNLIISIWTPSRTAFLEEVLSEEGCRNIASYSMLYILVWLKEFSLARNSVTGSARVRKWKEKREIERLPVFTIFACIYVYRFICVYVFIYRFMYFLYLHYSCCGPRALTS